MRLYTFINYYLSSIQQGIQTGHILGEIVNNMRFEDATGFKPTMVREFLEKHKTFVVCNGGNLSDLREFMRFLVNNENPYPWAGFYEDDDSLNGMLTGFGIILPADIYDYKSEMRQDPITKQRVKIYVLERVDENGEPTWPYILDNPDTYKYQLVDRIKSAPLAR